MEELQDKLMDIALNHPTIGIGQVKVPRIFDTMLSELRKIKEPYLRWDKYKALFSGIHKMQYNTKVD